MFDSQADAVSGVQFDLQYDGSAMSLAATLGHAARNSGKSLYYADLAPNKRRFLIVGLNRNLIPGGTLIDLFVNLNSDTPDGVYPLAVSNVIATDPYGNPALATGADGAVMVQKTIGGSTRLQPAGVLNGGSLLPGPIAPGEVVTLIGSGIGPVSVRQPSGSLTSTVLAGTSVLFDGTPAPLLYAALDQINAIIPYGVSGKTATQMQVTYEGQVIAGLALPVIEAAPAIFTLDSSGVGPAVILNQDFTVNSPSNPASRGSLGVLFATGAGQTDPAGVDGQVAGSVLPKPTLPISVEIGGLKADVIDPGAAPTSIAGVLQVYFSIPANVMPGYSVSVVLVVGTVSSQVGVTMAVQ